jgi:hypothetical protein
MPITERPGTVETAVSGGEMLVSQACRVVRGGLSLGPNGFAILDGGAVG